MKRFLVSVFVVGCAAEPATEVNFTGSLPTDMDADVVVWLWGYDEGLQDAGASLIASYHQPFASTLELAIPENPHELIDQGNGPVPAHDARFYFGVYVDLDRDSQICPGDLRQDFDALAFQSYATPPNTLTVPLTTIAAGNNCHGIVP